MKVTFEQGGVRYQLLLRGSTRREREVALEDIRPDLKLWPNDAQRAKAVSGLASPEEVAARNQVLRVKRQKAWRQFYAGKRRERP